MENDRESSTFEQIKDALEKVQRIFINYNIPVYFCGGIVPYLLLNQNSNRLHDDIDIITKLENMPKLREIFKKTEFYIGKYDSMMHINEEIDYGFMINVDGVPVGIYPYTYEENTLRQYSFNPYNTRCKIKEIHLKELSDYLMTYKSVNGTIYNTMSLEYIKKTKEELNREKDIIDIKKIEETNLLRQDVIERIKPYTQIQNKKSTEINRENMGKKLVIQKTKIKNEQGYTDALIMSILTGFAAGIIFMMAYQIIISA